MLIFYFVVVLCHSNHISVISWQRYDVWDEEEKARAYTFTDSSNPFPPKPYMHGVRGTGLWWRCKWYTVQTWIAAQSHIMAVTEFIRLSPGSPIQCLNQLSYLPFPKWYYNGTKSTVGCWWTMSVILSLWPACVISRSVAILWRLWRDLEGGELPLDNTYIYTHIVCIHMR